MLAGVLPVVGGEPLVGFRSPVFIGLLAALVVSLVVCCFRRKWSFKRAGFLLCHVSVIVILAGAFAGFLFSKKTTFSLPVSEAHAFRNLPTSEGGTIALDFGITVKNFRVEYYTPGYRLYRPPADPQKGDAVFEGEFRFSREGVLDLGEHGRPDVSDLRDESTGKWKRRHVLKSGWALHMTHPAPRHFEATLRFTDEDKDFPLTVNHPVSHEGWRFYLMSYDEKARRSVVLSARRDPGRIAVIAGFWMLMAGVAVLCFRKTGGEYGAG